MEYRNVFTILRRNIFTFTILRRNIFTERYHIYIFDIASNQWFSTLFKYKTLKQVQEVFDAIPDEPSVPKLNVFQISNDSLVVTKIEEYIAMCQSDPVCK